MEIIKLRYQQIQQAYSRLAYMVGKFKELSLVSHTEGFSLEKENDYITHRDALIKRFEFCYELTWKFFQLILKEKYLVFANSPRSVFQEAYQLNFLNREQVAVLLEMIDSRNTTTHKYDEAAADELAHKIVDYYDVLVILLEKLKPD